MAVEKPIGIALIVCDQIIQDVATNKRSLIGVFNLVYSEAFPFTLHKLCVMASITQINGNVKIALDCSDETHDEALVSIPGNASSSDPNAVLDMAFELDQFTFPRPGIYCFELR